jgi:hypothetical protein
MRLPPVPTGWPDHRYIDGSVVALLGNGDVVEGSLENVRYDPSHHRFLPGMAAVCSDCGIEMAGEGQTVWEVGGNSGCLSAYLSGFPRNPATQQSTPRVPRVGGAQVNGIAVGKGGRAWIAGWRATGKDSCGWLEGFDVKQHAQGLPSATPKGWAAIFVADPKTGHVRTIHAAAPAPLTGIALQGRYVWTIEPFHRCRSWAATHRCLAPRLLRYDTKSQRFRTIIIPRRLGLRAGGGSYCCNTPMVVGPHGAVWIVARARTRGHAKAASILLGFRRGRFSERWLGFSSIPKVDAKGRVWLAGIGDHPWILNPRTGRVAVLSLKEAASSRTAIGGCGTCSARTRLEPPNKKMKT